MEENPKNNKKKSKDLFEKWIEAGEAESNLAIVQSLSMQGSSIEQIAEHFKITGRTMFKLKKAHPALEKAIKAGRASVVAMCQNKLMEKVSSGDTTAIIYALKVYGGEFFRDRSFVKTEVSGTGGKPVDINQTHVYLPEKVVWS